MQTACGLHNLPIWETSDDLGSHLVTGVLLTKLSVVIPSNTVNRGGDIILMTLILCHYYWMIITARDINDLWFFQGIY